MLFLGFQEFGEGLLEMLTGAPTMLFAPTDIAWEDEYQGGYDEPNDSIKKKI